MYCDDEFFSAMTLSNPGAVVIEPKMKAFCYLLRLYN